MHILLVIPVYNEEDQLTESVTKVVDWCAANISGSDTYQIVIGDNASTDSTPTVCQKLANHFPGIVRTSRLEQKGRGRMLSHIWLNEDFDFSLYMDVDLATDIRHIAEAITAAKAGADVVIGSRLMRQSEVTNRSIKRKFFSRLNMFCSSFITQTRISDFQCGFKGLTKATAQALVPSMTATHWFLDVELIVLAKHTGYSITELPVKWTDDPDTRVNFLKDIPVFAFELFSLALRKPWKNIPRKSS